MKKPLPNTIFGDHAPADLRYPVETGRVIAVLRPMIAIAIRVLLRLYTRFEIVGHENIRTNRSFVMVANHSSHLDAVCLLAALPIRKLERAFSAAAEDYFFRNLSRRWIASVVVNALPFSRRHHVRESLEACRDLLGHSGTILVVFPEGTRSTTGEIQEFKAGIGALVAGRDISVLPCYLEGTARVWPKGKYLFRPHKVRLIIGEPRQYGSCSRADARPHCFGSSKCGARLEKEAMKLTEQFIESWDGTRLFYRAWLPDAPVKNALFLFHRGHEHSGRWEELVKAVQRSDMAIFAWDARGHGKSDGPRGYADSVSDLEKDVEVFARHIWQTHNIRAEDTIVLAHSLAAVTVGAWVHDYAPPLRGLILATAAFRVKLYVPLALLALRIRQSLFGEGQVKSFVRGSMLTGVPEEAERYNNDPLIFRQISTGLLIDLNDTAKRLIADAGAIETPTLMLSAGRDWVVKQDAQQEFFDGLSSPIKRMEMFPTVCHALFHDTERAEVFRCIREFVAERFAEAPRDSIAPDATTSAHTWREYEALQNGNGGGSRFALARAGLKMAGHLSDGIATGWRSGFDSGASLDYIYRNQAQGSLGLGRLIDRSYLNTIGWRGIRQRRTNLQAALRSAIQSIHDEGREVRILDIAAGVGRYVIETIASVPNIRVRACLRDYQQENIDRIRALADEFRLTDIVAERKDAFDRASFADFQPRATIGLVSGLYELFPSNDMVTESLAGLADAVEPGGFLIYTNQPWHPQMEFIARVLRNHRGKPWVMRRRTTAEIDHLVARAGFQKLSMHIDRWGMFTVSIARRTA